MIFFSLCILHNYVNILHFLLLIFTGLQSIVIILWFMLSTNIVPNIDSVKLTNFFIHFLNLFPYIYIIHKKVSTWIMKLNVKTKRVGLQRKTIGSMILLVFFKTDQNTSNSHSNSLILILIHINFFCHLTLYIIFHYLCCYISIGSIFPWFFYHL